MREKQCVRKALEDDCETPGKFKGVDGEMCDSLLPDTRPRKVTPMDLIKTVNCTRHVFIYLCVCVCVRENGGYEVDEKKLCPEEEKKAGKQALLILILIFIFILVGRRGINSCTLHSQKCVRCEMFEKRQQQQQVQGPCRLQ